MAEYTGGSKQDTILDLLDFNTPDVGYEDMEKRDVCGCCGTHYVVSLGELADIKERVTGLYEALGTIKRTTESSGDKVYLQNVLRTIARISREALAPVGGK